MFAILRISKLKTAGNIGGLNAHLNRTMKVPNADPDLTNQNHRIIGTENLNADVQDRIKEAGITPRKNGVLAIEHLITTSPEFFNGLTKKKVEDGKYVLQGSKETIQKYYDFANNSVKWLKDRYGTENVVNVTVHMDEKTPHLHAIVVPIDGKGRLNAAEFLGNREKMRNMQDTFAEVLKPLGLQRGISGSKAEHVAIKQYYEFLNKANEVRSEDPTIYEIKKPSIAEVTFSAERWTREQNEHIRLSAEALTVKLKDDAVKTNLERVKQLLDAKAGEAFKKAEKALRDEFKAEKEALVLGFKKEIDPLRKDNEILQTENKELTAKVSSLEKIIEVLRSWRDRFISEMQKFGLKMDFDKGKAVKMTVPEVEQAQKEQAEKRAAYIAEQQRKQEQEKNRGQSGGMRM